MSEQPPGRRWGDIENAIRIAVIQAMTEVRLTIDRLDKRTEVLWSTIFGNPDIRQPGVVDRLDKIEKSMAAIEEKIDHLIEKSEARDNQFLGAKKAFYVLAALVAFLGGPPAIAQILKAFGVTP